VTMNAAPAAGQIPVYSASGLYSPTAFTLPNMADVSLTEGLAIDQNALIFSYASGGKWQAAPIRLGTTSGGQLDPVNGSSYIALSNASFTATGTSAAAAQWQAIRTLSSKTTGKLYAELSITNLAGGTGIGVVNSNESFGINLPTGFDTNGLAFLYNAGSSNGGAYYNGSFISGSIPSSWPVTGQVIGMAVDLGAKLVWFYNPATGLWNNDVIANQNPATGTGGYSISTIMAGGTGAIYIAVDVLGTGASATINAGGNTFAYTVPSGFSAWATSLNGNVQDVGVLTPVDGQLLVYNGASSQWVNTSAPDGNGFVDGNFDFWDVNTTFSVGTSDVYTATMWLANAGTGAATVSQSTRTLGSEPSYLTRPSKYRLAFNQTSTSTANPTIGQKFEGVGQYNGQSITVQASLAAAAALTGVTAVRYIQFFGTGGSPSSTVTGTTAVSWALTTTEQKFSVMLNIPSISGKTIGTNGNDYLRIDLLLATGATYTIYCSQFQVDVCPATASTNTTGTGGVPHKFRYAGLRAERTRVSAYFYKSYNDGVNPGSATGAGAMLYYVSGPVGSNAAALAFHYGIRMRTTPAVTYYSPATGASGMLRDAVNAADVTASPQTNGQQLGTVAGVMGTTNNYINMQGHCVADARL
jgi:hypothetical protein